MSYKYIFLLFIGTFLFTNCEQAPYQQGEILYVNFCSNCHMTDGEGLQNLIPPVNNGDYLRNNTSRIACAIRKGVEGEIIMDGRKFNNPMEAIPQLNDVEITNVINYMLYTWGETDKYVSNQEVKDILAICAPEE